MGGLGAARSQFDCSSLSAMAHLGRRALRRPNRLQTGDDALVRVDDAGLACYLGNGLLADNASLHLLADQALLLHSLLWHHFRGVLGLDDCESDRMNVLHACCEFLSFLGGAFKLKFDSCSNSVKQGYTGYRFDPAISLSAPMHMMSRLL